MRNRNDYIIVEKKGNSGKWVFLVFFGIIGFIAIYYPFIAPNLRYQTRSIISPIFKTIGTLCIGIGGLMIGWGLISLIAARSLGGLKLMILGAVLIFIGGYFISPSIVGATASGKEVPKGYH